MVVLSNSNLVSRLRILLPAVPLLLKTLILAGLRLSDVSGKQDLRTQLTVAIIRYIVSKPLPVGVRQRSSLRDPGVRGPMWVSKVCLPAPEDDVQVAVAKAFEALKSTGTETFTIPKVAPVEAEWTGYRTGVNSSAPQPDLPEKEKYHKLKRDSPADMIILYFHGGAYFMADPCTHRIPVTRLSKVTGAPVLSVRYRLAPQNPFPAALVDALIAYLSLVSPPPGSFHEPVPSNKILLAGDSAGGNLCLTLLLTLLTLRRISPSLRFHGMEILVELPAGVITSSPWCDATTSLPSMSTNSKFDFINPRTFSVEALADPLSFPPDNVWPCSPPRVDMYSNADAVIHPLVSPLAAHKAFWQGAPPILFTIGEEALADEALITARKVHQSGGTVMVEHFEGMPHCFGLIMLETPVSHLSFRSWAQFCRDAVAGQVKKSGNVSFFKHKLQSTVEIPLDEVHPFRDEDVEKLIRSKMEKRVEVEKALVSRWRENFPEVERAKL